jgi:HD-GYP domain-containing protein (c-di-GMP phosphodiesterase class II)/sensor domain CHASE-containing protein
VRRALHWNVRARFLAAFVIVAVVPLVVFAVLVYARTTQALHDVEQREIVSQASGVQEILRDQTAKQRDFLGDYAIWDGFYQHLAAGDVTWIEDNVSDWVPANSDTKLVQVYDMRGNSVATGSEAIPEGLWKTDEVQAARGGRISADLETIGGRLFILAAGPVRTMAGDEAPAGVLVFGQPVTDALLSRINRFTGGEGRLAVYTDSRVSAATEPSEDNVPATFRPAGFRPGEVFTEGDYTSQLVALNDKNDEVVSLLKVSVPRAAFTEAVAAINAITLLAFVGALLVAVLMGMAISATISRPLSRLAQATAEMARGDYRQRLPVQRHDEIGALADSFNAMSERVATQVESLSRKTQSLGLEISNLSAFGATLAQTPDPHAELQRLADMIRAVIGADTAALALVYEGHTTRVAYSGDSRDPVPSPAADELAAWVVENGTALQIDDAETDAHLSTLARATNQLRSLLVVPLARQEGVIGALTVGYRDRHDFGPEELPLLATIGGQIAIALQNAEAYEKLDRMYLETVTALAAAMEAKDQYTASHADSLAAMAIAVGSQMGLSDAELRMLQYAAVLHDIGKIGIPGNILNKPDKLTREEFETMAQHTIIGERIISRIDYLVPIARIIRSAHERWDGEGYPDGLAGEEIPLAARILLVCDAFDAMTTDRPYRRALPVDVALEELAKHAGSQFDPRVVDVFLASYPFREVDAERVLDRLSYAGLVEFN